ncbi:hypothetical protein [Fluviicola sp.]|uniref:hypothetical protein n=1 Tax=Fluviicola sp. TaxID=1917219 RepID=UPI0031D3709F
MRLITHVILPVFLLVTICTCKKYAGDYDPNYIGEWHSETVISDGEEREIYLKINGKQSEYGFLCQINCNSCNCQELTSGKAVINKKGNVLYVGSGNNHKRFKLKIKKAPYQTPNGNWEMVIDSGTEITLHKV